MEGIDDAVRVVHLAFGGIGGILEGIPAVGRAENGPAESEDASHVRRRQGPGAGGVQEAVEAVLQADDLDTGVAGGLDHRPDHRVQPGRVAAPGQDSNLSNEHGSRL